VRGLPAPGSRATPLLFVLEDVHWIDPASLDLLEAVVRTVADLPVLVVLAYRPLENAPDALRRIERLPYFTCVPLAELDPAEVEQLVRAKLAQFAPERGNQVPAALIERIAARAQGNPFYAEELLNYVRDRGLDPHDAVTVELPDSLQRLILSRIDQLDDRQRIVLKVASIIGRQFRFSWLYGYYPELGAPEAVKAELAGLARLDLTPLDQPEPELVYLFKHVVTQEVTYASLSQAVRAELHERLAHYLEGLGVERHLDLLAYHYARSANTAKTREYLRRAGNAAAARFANLEATEYLSRALELVPEGEEAARYDLLLAREQVCALQGASEEQARDLTALVACAAALAGDTRRAEVAVRQARYLYQRKGDYPAALAAAERALALAEAAGADRLAAEAHLWGAWALVGMGDPRAAHVHAEASLARARGAGDTAGEARALNCLGNTAREQRDLARAQAHYLEALAHARRLGDRSLEGAVLNNLGSVAYDEGNYAACRAYTEQSLLINREIGRRRIEATVLGNLGELALAYGDAAAARADLEGSLALFRDLDHHAGEGWVLANLGVVGARTGDLRAACECVEEGVRLLRLAGERTWEASALIVLGDACLGAGQPDKAAVAYRQAVQLRDDLGEPGGAMEPLAGLARVALAKEDLAGARAQIAPILASLETGDLDRVDDPLTVYLTCYQVLRAAGDPRADIVLRKGHELLLARAAKIDDARMRRMYLEEVPHHREIAEAWWAYTT
jgi:tetratricopeptide (TPR) repeat protein